MANPKDVDQKALKDSSHFAAQLRVAMIIAIFNSYDGDRIEHVDAVSLPILMPIEDVDSKDKVEEPAEKN